MPHWPALSPPVAGPSYPDVFWGPPAPATREPPPRGNLEGGGACIRGSRLLEASPEPRSHATNWYARLATTCQPPTSAGWIQTAAFPGQDTEPLVTVLVGSRHNSIGGSMHTKSKLGAVVVSLAAAATLTISGPAQADHQGQDRTYPSCTSLNRDFKHGVGRRGAVDRSSSTRVTNFTRNTRVYLLNNGPRTPGAATGQGQYDLDRDNDGIACEKL